MIHFFFQLMAITASAIMISCTTPIAVKQLSVAQVDHFNTAIHAVELQSKALVLAAKKISDQAEQHIDQRQQERLNRVQQVMIEVLPTLDASKRKAETKRLLDDVEQKNRNAEAARAKLADDLQAITDKTQVLQAYFRKMQESQIALDAYLQSEQAGEQATEDFASQPTVGQLIGAINDLIPQMTDRLNDVKTLIGGAGATAVPLSQSTSTTTAAVPDIHPPTPARVLPPEDAFLSANNRRIVQQRLCVMADDLFGFKTRRAIREYQESIGIASSTSSFGQLSKVQADQLIQSDPCPSQFETYYERLHLNQIDRIQTLQKMLNEIRADGIVDYPSPLVLTDQINTQTRDMIKALQKTIGISPADGVYTSDTAKAVTNIVNPLNNQEDDLTALLKRFWRPEGQVNRANQEKLKAAMEEANVDPNLPISLFLRSAEFAEQRKQVAFKLGISP